MSGACHIIINFFEVSKQGAPLAFTCWAIPQVNWVANIHDKFWDFFHLLTTVSSWSCPSTLSRYVRCSFFLALTRVRTFACSQLGSLDLLDWNSTDSALWAFFAFHFLFFFLGWACCFIIMGRCTTNMTTAKQSTIITLVVYFFEYIFFFPNNWTRSICCVFTNLLQILVVCFWRISSSKNCS